MKKYVALAIVLVFGGFVLTEFTLEDSFAINDSQTNLAVGIIGKDIGDVTSVGAVYIFDDENNNADYSLTKTMTNPNELSHGQFGQFIAYQDNNNKLAVAAPWKYDKDDNPIGEIYILDGTTGELLQTISNPNPYDNDVDEFGIAVAFVGDKIAVGAPVQPANSQFVGGTVYLFDADTGNLIRSITDSNPQELDMFGHSVASLGDDKIAIGIPGKDVKGIDFAGAVSIFDVNTGSLVKTIKNPEPDDHDEFGKFIVSNNDNNQLLVGAHHRNVDGKTSAGSVYLFDADTGSLALTIHNPDPDDDAYFGKSVLFANDKIVVGAPGNGTFEQGSVYIFESDTGLLLETIDNPQRIRPSEFGYTNEFGLSLVFDGNDHLAIGDPGKIVDEILNVGGVYIYDLRGDLIQTIDNPDPIRDDSFGHFVTFVGLMEFSFDDNLLDKTTTDKSNSDSKDSHSVDKSEPIQDNISDIDNFTIPKNISNTSRDSVYSHIAVDGKNIYVTWNEQIGSGGANEIFFSKSVDGGENFSTPKKISDDSGTWQVTSIAVDDDKNIFLIWMDRFEDKRSVIFLSKSMDGGETFSEPQRISNKTYFASLAEITTDGKNVFIVWNEGPHRENDIIFSKSIDGGETFSEPQNISNNEGSSTFSSIVTDGTEIFITWQDKSSGIGDIFLSKSIDGGETFSEPQNISNTPNSSVGSHIITDGTSIYVIWLESDQKSIRNLFFSKSIDGGETFSEPQNISNSREYSSSPVMTTDDNKNIFVIWSDSNSKNGNVFFSKSTDGGETFSEPQNISNNDKGFSDDNSMTTDDEEIFIIWSWRFISGSTPSEIFFSKSSTESQPPTTNESENISENDDGDDTAEISSINWVDELGADYAAGGFGAIKMIHPGLNINKQLIDIPAVHVWSDTDPQGIQVEAIETGADTGVFYADVDFVKEESSHLSLQVSNEDTVTASFVKDLPSSSDNNSDSQITDTVKITAKYLSPSKQSEQEIPIDEIVCMDDDQHKLFIKDGTKPLCLKQETYDLLVARGYF